MHLRRPVLLSCFALVALLSCGSKSPKSFDVVATRGPVTQKIVSLNVTAAANDAIRARQALTFAVGEASRRRNNLMQYLGSFRAATPTPPEFQVAAVSPTSSLPPDWVIERESHGDYNAYNPTGCGGAGCFGRYQFSGAWAGKLGLPLDLSQATPEQQDAAARELWANGAGCQNWSACG